MNGRPRVVGIMVLDMRKGVTKEIARNCANFPGFAVSKVLPITSKPVANNVASAYS